MKNRKGFTLVELLVVVVILGIITGLSIPLIRNIQNSNEKKEYKAYLDTLKYSAKLYVDSYGEDLFGRHKSGCTIIRFKELQEKGLLKDITIDKVSCNSDETFVKVVKMDNKYGYAPSIGCGRVDANNQFIVDVKYPEEGLSINNATCDVDAISIMDFYANPTEDTSINFKKRNIKVTITSDTGINDNVVIYYGFSYTKDSNVINNDWKKVPVIVPGKKSQKNDIYDGKTIRITSDNLITPEGVTGKLYLVLQVEKLENLSGEKWTGTIEENNFKYFGPYTVDNMKPQFNDSTVISSESEFNSVKPQLQLKVTDEKYSLTDNLRMCISYDTDTCSTVVADIKDNSKYEKYDANKVLPKISNSYDSSTHTIFVTVADAAGNYEKASFTYRVAQRYTLTYDSNGGTECNPNSISYTFNNWEKTVTWGTLCQSTRNNYEFLGWETADGTLITSSSEVKSNITAIGKWKRIAFKVTLHNTFNNKGEYVVKEVSVGECFGSKEVFVDGISSVISYGYWSEGSPSWGTGGAAGNVYKSYYSFGGYCFNAKGGCGFAAYRGGYYGPIVINSHGYLNPNTDVADANRCWTYEGDIDLYSFLRRWG